MSVQLKPLRGILLMQLSIVSWAFHFFKITHYQPKMRPCAPKKKNQKTNKQTKPKTMYGQGRSVMVMEIAIIWVTYFVVQGCLDALGGFDKYWRKSRSKHTFWLIMTLSWCISLRSKNPFLSIQHKICEFLLFIHGIMIGYIIIIHTCMYGSDSDLDSTFIYPQKAHFN